MGLMREPERRERRAPLPAEDSRRVTRAAALRPINLLTLILGVGVSLTTQWWLLLPLTLVVYTALVALASRDPLFQHRVLHGGEAPPVLPGSRSREGREVSPERRSRWIPRGETRRKVEEALVTYRKVISTLEQTDEVTRTVLEDTPPKLHAAADRLVDVALRRERAASEVQRINQRSGGSQANLSGDLANILHELEEELRTADSEISRTIEQLQELRSRIIRISVSDNSAARAEASVLASSLDEMNFRLDALGETLPPNPPTES